MVDFHTAELQYVSKDKDNPGDKKSDDEEDFTSVEIPASYVPHIIPNGKMIMSQ